MKKITWIIALLAALVLIFAGCPGEGDNGGGNTGGGGGGGDGGGGGNINLAEVFSDTPINQDKATVTVSGSTASFAYKGAAQAEIWGELITPEGALWNVSAYTGIKFEYRAPNNATILIFDANDIFIFKNGSTDGWAAISFADNWTEISLPFSTLTEDQDWIDDSKTTQFSKSIHKLMFSSTGDTGEKFELRNFQAY